MPKQDPIFNKDDTILDLAVGSLRGIRAFGYKDRLLTGVSYAYQWLPGENEAACEAYPGSVDLPPDKEDQTYDERREQIEAWKGAHAMTECKHGFYAYFSKYQGQHFYTNGPAVFGVVEGYGEVLIGTRGFRATRARILALCIEPWEDTWEMNAYALQRIKDNYPDIPIFKSRAVMEKDFPLSKAEEFALGEDELENEFAATPRAILDELKEES